MASLVCNECQRCPPCPHFQAQPTLVADQAHQQKQQQWQQLQQQQQPIFSQSMMANQQYTEMEQYHQQHQHWPKHKNFQFGPADAVQNLESQSMSEQHHQPNAEPQRPALNYPESESNATCPGEDDANQDQKVLKFKNRDYLLYEGRIIDEREADRIYAQYHELLLQRKQKAANTTRNSSAVASDNETSMASSNSASATSTETGQSNAQWKKDETMLLQYIILNVAEQRDTLVENFSDSDWQTVANLVPGRSSLQCPKRWRFI